MNRLSKFNINFYNIYLIGKSMRKFISNSKTIRTFLLGIMLLGCLTSCYRMPGDDDYSVVPVTNNPDFTKCGKGGAPGMPSSKF